MTSKFLVAHEEGCCIYSLEHILASSSWLDTPPVVKWVESPDCKPGSMMSTRAMNYRGEPMTAFVVRLADEEEEE